MATEASIRIKLGQIEVEYKGGASFLKKDLLETVKELLELQKQHPAAAQQQKVGGGGNANASGSYDHSTDTIANAMNVDSGPELLMAAAAHFHFVKGQEKFSRAALLKEMQTATGHWKPSYRGNMTQSLNSLKAGGKERLRQGSDGTYSLSSKERQSLEAKLATI